MVDVLEAIQYAVYQNDMPQIPMYGIDIELSQYHVWKMFFNNQEKDFKPPEQFRVREEENFLNRNSYEEPPKDPSPGIEMNVIEMQPKKPPQEKRGKPEDYKKISLIGKGSFGTVYLVERISDKKLFAMKVLEKLVCLEYD